jgi:DNA-directed RNA polymerase II subunit RPB1
MKPELETDKQKTQQMLHVLEHTKLRDVVKSVSICFDPDDLETLIDEDRPLMSQYREFEMMMRECAGMGDEEEPEGFVRSKWIVRFVMDKEQMLERNITMDDIHFAIKNGYKDYTECVFSDYNADKLVFRLRLMDVLSNKKKGLAASKQAGLDQSDEIYMIQNIQENLLDGIILKGVRGIRGVVMRKQKGMLTRKNGAYVENESWVLDTIGTNLLDILGMPGLDNTRTFSNDIIETYRVLGIEATRQMIYNEIAEVMEHGGAFIDYHHLGLLCDRMTVSKNLVSIFRHGINNDDIGPIAKASFEETPEMFLRAARHAELDPMRGVSANVMCGQRGNFGTSSFGLVLDVDAMARFGEKRLEERTDIEKMFTFESPDDPCASEKIQNTIGVELIRPEDMGDDDDDYNPGF